MCGIHRCRAFWTLFALEMWVYTIPLTWPLSNTHFSLWSTLFHAAAYCLIPELYELTGSSIWCPPICPLGLYAATNEKSQVHYVFTPLSRSSLSRDIDHASSVLVGCALQRCWDCQRKYTVLVWNPGVLRQSVKFGHYSCNSAFMFRSQGSCVQQPQQGFPERAAGRDVGSGCHEDHIKTASYVHEECWMSERHLHTLLQKWKICWKQSGKMW